MPLTMYRNPAYGYGIALADKEDTAYDKYVADQAYQKAMASSSAGSISSGYWKGPGGWVYKVSGSSVTVVWSPISRSLINKAQDASAASKILAELRTSKEAVPYSSQDAAISAAKATLPARSASPAPSPSVDPTIPPAVAGTPFYQNPWVIGGASVLLLGTIAAIVFWPKKK